MQEKDHRDPECRVEIVENESKRSEERLHHQEDQVDDQMKGPEASGGPIKACHEVDNDVVDEDSRCREGKISKHVGNWVCSSSIHGVARLSHAH